MSSAPILAIAGVVLGLFAATITAGMLGVAVALLVRRFWKLFGVEL